MSENNRNVSILGITGGIACGKSEVGRILEKTGYAVCDADRVAHGLMERGTPVHRHLVECFGRGVLSGDGGISRPALAEIVFRHPEQRERLDGLVHPAVREVLEDWIAECRSKGTKAAVQVPLLFESGMDSLDFDAVVCVSSSREQVFNRLEKRGMNRDEASRRIGAQMPLDEKERRADGVIRNLGTLLDLEQAVERTVEGLLLKGRYE